MISLSGNLTCVIGMREIRENLQRGNQSRVAVKARSQSAMH